MKKNHTFVLSDSRRVNSYGFRIDLSGMDLSRFRSNPVMLYQHDPERVIGRWEGLRIEKGRLLAEAVFDESDALAQEVSRKVEEGFLKGCSIGLMVRAMEETDGESVATRSELFEASIVSVPSDAGAVRLYDENHKILSAEALYMQFSITNPKNHEQMERIEQLEATVAEQNSRIATLDSEVEHLRQENEQLLAERVEMLLRAAVDDGRIRESERVHFERLAQSDYETVRALLDGMVPGVAGAQRPATLSGMMQHAPKAEDERSGWSYLEWSKKDPEGLRRMRTEQPERFEELAAGRA